MMSERDRTSLRKWLRPLAAAVVLGALLAAAAGTVFSSFAQTSPQDVLRRTPTPTRTRTVTNTPTITNTPTKTNTPTNTPTPTSSPTPFATKDRGVLGDTVIIGGSTGSQLLSTCCLTYVPMFDGGAGSSFGGVGHVVLPGAITHLSVQLDHPAGGGLEFTFSISINGKKSHVSCTTP